MGEEFGEFNDKSMDPRPPHFELLDHPKNKDLYDHTRKLIELRKTNGALKTDRLEFIHLDEQNKLIAWKRWDEAGTVVAVVVNFSDRPLKGYVVANFPKELNHEFVYDYPVRSMNKATCSTTLVRAKPKFILNIKGQSEFFRFSREFVVS